MIRDTDQIQCRCSHQVLESGLRFANIAGPPHANAAYTQGNGAFNSRTLPVYPLNFLRRGSGAPTQQGFMTFLVLHRHGPSGGSGRVDLQRIDLVI